jgi:hypothetical protein
MIRGMAETISVRPRTTPFGMRSKKGHGTEMLVWQYDEACMASKVS